MINGVLGLPSIDDIQSGGGFYLGVTRQTTRGAKNYKISLGNLFSNVLGFEATGSAVVIDDDKELELSDTITTHAVGTVFSIWEDVPAASTITIGAADTTTVIPGNLDVNGTTTTIDTTNLAITDKLIRLNREGTLVGATATGLEIEGGGDGVIVGYIKFDELGGGTTTVLRIKAPDEASYMGLNLANLTADRVQSFQDVTGNIAVHSADNAFNIGQTITQGAITDPKSGISNTVAWNDVADTFTGWFLNVTDTASNAASLLMDLQVGGTSVFNVSKNGNLALLDTADAADGMIITGTHSRAGAAVGVSGDTALRIVGRAKDDAGTVKTTGNLIFTIRDAAAAGADGGLQINMLADNVLKQVTYQWNNGTNSILNVGDGASSGIVQSDGDFNMIFRTGNAITGSIEIVDGANGNISLLPNGSGAVVSTSAADGVLRITQNADAAAVQVAILRGQRLAPANADIGYMTLQLNDSLSNSTEYARISWGAVDIADGSEDGELLFGVVSGGVFANELRLIGTSLSPVTPDGLALGTAAEMWSDLFLASGSVVNFNNGDVTITHIAGKLTLGGDGAVEIDFANNEMTNVDINSGAIDGTTIGATTPSTAVFTTVFASNGSNDVLTVTGTEDIATGRIAILQRDRETPAINDQGWVDFRISDDTGQAIGCRIGIQITDITAATADVDMFFSGELNGAQVEFLRYDASADLTVFSRGATFAGITIADLGIVTTVDINGGTMAGVTIDGALTWSAAQDLNNQALTNVNIDSGVITGITDLAVADGGTGLSTFGGANTLLYTSAADVLSSIATANSGVLVTSGAGVPSISSTLPQNGSTVQVVALDAATTIAVTSNVVYLTAVGAETLTTITGGITGQLLTLICGGAGITFTDTAWGGAADTLCLTAAHVSAAGTTIVFVKQADQWVQIGIAING